MFYEVRFHTNEQIYKNLWFQQFQLELISHYLEVQKFPQKQSTFHKQWHAIPI